jgi:hypothetical protein
MITNDLLPERQLICAVIGQAVLDLQRPELTVRQDARRFLRSQDVAAWLACLELNGQRQHVEDWLREVTEAGFSNACRVTFAGVVSPW